MQIIALINQKGGVGKATCAINMEGPKKLGKRVLLINLDPRAHLFNLRLRNAYCKG